MTTRKPLPAAAFGAAAAAVDARERLAAANDGPVVDARVDASVFRRKPSSDWRG